MAVPQAAILVPTKGHLSLVSRQSANDKDDTKMIPETGINLRVEDNPRKIQLGYLLMNAVRPDTASNGVPYF